MSEISTPEGTEHRVGSVSDFDGGARLFIWIDSVEVGVIRYEGEFFAYANVCPHQGGPVCEGLIIGKVEEDLDELGRVERGRFSEDRIHLVCPWHGMEFDLRTGRCAPDPRRRLRRYEVVAKGEDVYVCA